MKREAFHFRFIGHIWQKYGHFVGHHPVPFLIFPLLIALALSTGIYFIDVEDDLRILYSPTNAPSRREFRVHEQFAGNDTDTYCALAVEGSFNSSKNLLTKRRADLILNLNNYVLNNMTLDINNKIYHFGKDICPKISYCPNSNQLVKKFLDIYWNPKLLEDPKVQLRYPIMEIYDARFFLPAQLYGVLTDPSSGNVVQVNMVHMVYPIPPIDKNVVAEEVVYAFEKALHQYFETQPGFLDNFAISLFSQRILKEEINKNTTYTLPFISVTSLLIVAFTVCSCITSDMMTSKPIEGLLGVGSAALSIVSSAGLMGFMGVPFISQVTVMPFLALAIGVDDTYVMLGAWQLTDRRLSLQKRLGLTMKEAGSSITVTSLTDCIAFAIGAISTTPAISIFCMYVCAAIFFDFFFQVTFFLACVAIGGKREAEGKHSVMMWKQLDSQVVNKALAADFISPMSKFFAGYYSKLICHGYSRFIVISTYSFYWIFSLYGCTILTANMSPTTLLVDDSPLRHYISLAEKHIWAEGLVGRVYVNNPPDFSNNITGKQDIEDFFRFVADLEKTHYSIGSNSTQLWLIDFMDYMQYFDALPKDFYYNLRGFLDIEFNSHWKSYLKWLVNPHRLNEKYVNNFYFTTGFQVKNWHDRTEMLQEWRNVCASHSRFDALVYDENNFFGDQVLYLPSTSMLSIGVAILVMSVICLLFINDVRVCFWVMFSMLSMDVGIIGLLSLWGSDLSPTTIQNILMSIGLCVDFVTHVGYRIYRTHSKNPDDTISEALGAIAWPVLQGGLSTFLAVVSLQFVASFVVRIFFRTVFLVVLLGLYHGLVLLPIILRTFIPSVRYSLFNQTHKIINDGPWRRKVARKCPKRQRTLNYDTFGRTHENWTSRTKVFQAHSACDNKLELGSKGNIVIQPLVKLKPSKAWQNDLVHQ